MKVTIGTVWDVKRTQFGLVMMNAAVSTVNARDAWATPCLEFLQEEKAVREGIDAETFWSELQILNAVTSDRTDLVMSISEEGMKYVDVGRLAIVRLGMTDMKWIEDWLVQSANEFNHQSVVYPN